MGRRYRTAVRNLGVFGAGLSIALAMMLPVALVADAQSATSQVSLHAYNLCLDDTGWSTTQGTRMQLYTCTGNSNQAWIESITYLCQYCGPVTTVQNVYSGLCLNVSGGSHANFTPAIQWGCNINYSNEAFKVIPSVYGAPNFSLYVPGTGTCLDDPYHSLSVGTKLEFYQCNNSEAQIWTAPNWIGVWP
jgi:Ricin-type beta-trefoil lectin domain-like